MVPAAGMVREITILGASILVSFNLMAFGHQAQRMGSYLGI